MAAAAPAAGSPEDFQRALDNVARHLSSEDLKDVAASTVTLALMLQNTQLPADLSAIVPALAGLLQSQELAVQRNAAAALAAALESSDTAVQAALDARVAEQAVSLLESREADPGLQLNALVLLCTLSGAGEATAQRVLEAGGLDKLLARAEPGQSEQLLEAAVDGLCAQLSSSAAAKDAAQAAGAIPRLAALVGSSDAAASSTEVRVRALLALGMLAGGHPGRQVELAAAPGAVAALLRLMRQQDDGDIQHVAAGLFKELATNGEAKEAIAAALKEQQAADAAGVTFV